MAKRKASFSLKRVKISKDQQLAALAVAIIIISLIATYFFVTRYTSRISYQQKTIEEVQANIELIDDIKQDRDTLQAEYRKFYEGSKINTIGNANNTEIIKRALYRECDTEALKDEFVRFLDSKEYPFQKPYTYSVDGDPSFRCGELVDQEVEGVTGLEIVSFNLTVKNLQLECTNIESACLERLLEDLDLLASPTKITSINVKFPYTLIDDTDTNAVQPQSNSDGPLTVEVSLGLEIYIKKDEPIIINESVDVKQNEDNPPVNQTTQEGQ